MKYNKNEILGFETDTVWGMGCSPFSPDCVEKIYEFKKRERQKPLILMSSHLENLKPFLLDIPDYAEDLIKKHFPGALTLIFKKTSFCPDYITANNDTIGIRIPNHKGFYEIAESFEGKVLATTSLNISNEPPCENYKEAMLKFGSKINVVKPTNQEEVSKRASSVVLCTGLKPVVLRQGDIEIII